MNVASRAVGSVTAAATAVTVVTVGFTALTGIFFDPTTVANPLVNPGLQELAIVCFVVAFAVTSVVAGFGLWMNRYFRSLHKRAWRIGIPVIVGAVCMPIAWGTVFGGHTGLVPFSLAGCAAGFAASVAFWWARGTPVIGKS